MTTKQFVLLFLAAAMFACTSTQTEQESKEDNVEEIYTDIQIAGAMKDVMWKGELAGVIELDSIQNKSGLYGLGPESFLTGELLVNNGQAYVSRVLTDSTMEVVKTFDVSAPFFVYGNVREWEETNLPGAIKSAKDLEVFIDEHSKELKRPFAFKLIGSVSAATIHIQNLPAGTKVSSPDEAHQGQTPYAIQNENVTIVGFFSTEHQGVFTHHDSWMHMHLITENEDKMGHLDEVEFDQMVLYLPKK